MALSAASHAVISIGAGAVTLDFATAPVAGDWSTILAGIGANDTTYGTIAQLDAGVQTITQATANVALVVSATNPPSFNTSGRYNSTLQLLQTKPRTDATGGAAFMIGRLQNSNAVPITNLNVSFLGGFFAGAAEQIAGQRVFFSLTGLANSWTNIAGLNWSVAGAIASSFSTAGWLPGANAYILFADDNNSAAVADNAYTVDNLVFTPTLGAAGTSLKWNVGHSVGGTAPSGNFEVSANQYWLNGATQTGFATGDSVSFTDTPASTATINVPANIGAATVTVNHVAGTYAIAGPGAITGAFVKNGAGTLNLTSNNTFSTSSISGGTIVTTAATPFGTGAVTLAGPTTLQADADLSVGGFAGTDVLAKTGTGALTTTAISASAATVNVDAGKLIIGNAAGFSSATSTINVNGGTLEVTAPTTATVIAGNVNFTNSATATITVNSPTEVGLSASGLTISKANALTSVGTITKAGLGTVRITAAQSLASNWTITGGFLEGANATAFGTGTITADAGWVSITGVTITNPIILNGGGIGVRSGVPAAPVENYAGPVSVIADSFLTPKRTSTFANYNGYFLTGALSGSNSLTVTGPIVAALLVAPFTPQNTPVNPSLAATTTTVGAVTLTNGANAYSGNFIVNSQQILSGLPAGGTGGDVFGTSTFTLKGGAIRVLDNGTVDNGVIAYNHPITVAAPNDAVNPGVATVFVDRQTNAAAPGGANLGTQGTFVGNTVQFTTLSIPAGQSFRTAGANAYGVSFSGATTVTGTGDVTFDTTTAPLTLAGGLGGGAFNLVKTGGSNLIITGPNTYTGNTTVNAGTLNISSGGLTVGSGQSLSGTGNVAGLVTVSGGGSVKPGNATGVGTLTLTDLTLGTSSVQYTFNAGTLGLVSVTNPNALIASGGSGSVTLNFLGLNPNPGTHTLIDYDGAPLTPPQFAAFVQGALFSRIEAVLVDNSVNTSVDLNVLGIKFPIWTGSFSTEWSTGVIGGTKNWVLNGGGAQTDFIASDKVVFNDTASAASPVVDISVADVTPSDILVDSTKNYTINGPFGIAGATPLVKTNTGKLTITGTNSFTGAVTINGGTVSVPTISDSGVAGTLGAGTTAIAIDNGTLEFTGVAGSTNRGITAGALGAAVSTPTGSTLTLAGVVGGAGALEKKDAGTVVLTGLTNTPASVTVSAGTLQIGDGTTAGSLGTGVVTNNAALIFNTPAANLAITADIQGTGTLVKSGAGNLSLGGTNPNTYTGLTTVSQGTLTANKPTGVNAIGGNLLINGGAVIYQGNNVGNQIPDTATITLDSGTFGNVTASGTNPVNPGAPETVTNVVVNGGTFSSSRATFTATGNIGVHGGVLQGHRGALIVANSLTVDGTGVVDLDGGSATALNEPRLRVGAGGLSLASGTINFNQTVGAAPTATSVGSRIELQGNVTSTGVSNLVRLNTAAAVAVAQVDLQGAARTFDVTGTLNVGAAGATVSVVNTSPTAGGIIKAGSGNLILTGANTYNGDTVIQDGTLTLTGTLSGSANIDVQSTKTFDVSGAAGGFTLGAAQILKGNGNVVGSTTIGGTLAPGASIGTLNFANDLIFGAGGIGLFEINKTGAIRTADLANVTGALTLAGTLNVTATGDSLIEGDSFNLFDAASFAGTMAAGTLPTLDVGLFWNTDNLGVDGTIVVVPEPGSVALLVMGTALLFRRRRQA